MKKLMSGPFLHVFLLILIYFVILLLFKNEIFSYKFDQNLITRYKCSQDIPTEPPCKRLFLSDSEIHIASGFLYANGANPIDYNFQHPPLLKYLFGYSIKLFSNPYFVQIGFGILFILLTYFLGLKVFKNTNIAAIAAFLLILDPLFIYISASALLDLGQGVFLLLYFITMLFYPKKTLFQGISLGLLLTSKFWGGSIFFVFLILAYLMYSRKLNIKKYILHWAIALVIFLIVYIKAFIDANGGFNILFFELKTLKYWLDHSVSSIFGSSILLFATGFFTNWWDNKELTKSNIWSFLWPIGLIISSMMGYKRFLKKEIDIKFFVYAISLLYLLYLGFQAPFPRYFILVLPFIYLSLSKYIFTLFNCSGK